MKIFARPIFCIGLALAPARGQNHAAESFTASGTAGAGFVQIANQNEVPATPAATGLIYFDANSRIAWKNAAGLVGVLDLNGASRTLTFSGNPTLADWFDQSVKTNAAPSFRTISTTGGNPGLSPANTLSSLKAVDVSGLVTGVSVQMLGYSSAADGGGGLYVYSSSSSAVPNNGTVVAPNTGSGRWIRAYSGPVNVKWFGATGDGTTNDYSAIVNAISAVNNQGVVYLPAGNYNIGASGLTILGQVGIVGDGSYSIGTSALKNTQILYTGSGTAVTINDGSGTTTHSFILQDIVINGGGVGAKGIQIGSLTGTPRAVKGTLRNVVVTGFASVGCEALAAQGVLFEGCRFIKNIGSGFWIGRSTGLSQALNTADTFIRCEFSSNGDSSHPSDGLDIYDAREVIFIGPVFESNFGNGVHVTSAQGADVAVPTGIKFIQPWFEGNNVGRTAAGTYQQICIDSPVSGRCSNIVLDQPYFSLTVVGGGSGTYYAGRFTDSSVEIVNPCFADGNQGVPWIRAEGGQTTGFITVRSTELPYYGTPASLAPIGGGSVVNIYSVATSAVLEYFKGASPGITSNLSEQRSTYYYSSGGGIYRGVNMYLGNLYLNSGAGLVCNTIGTTVTSAWQNLTNGPLGSRWAATFSGVERASITGEGKILSGYASADSEPKAVISAKTSVAGKFSGFSVVNSHGSTNDEAMYGAVVGSIDNGVGVEFGAVRKGPSGRGDFLVRRGSSNDGALIPTLVCSTFRDLTNTVAATIFSVDLLDGKTTSGTLQYAIEASDGTEVQNRSGMVKYSAVKKAGTVTASLTDVAGNQAVAVSSGTLTASWAFSGSALQVTATSSLAPTTLRVHFTLTNESDIGVTGL